MKKQKTIILLLLAVYIFMCLTACSENTAGGTSDENLIYQENSPYNQGTVYDNTVLDVPELRGKIQVLIPADKDWILAENNDGSTLIYRADHEFASLTPLNVKLPEINLTALGATKNGSILAAGYDADEKDYIYECSESAPVLVAESPDTRYINQLVELADGYLISDGIQILHMDKNGETLQSWSHNGHARIFECEDGSLIAALDILEKGADRASTEIIVFDHEINVTESYKVPFSFTGFALDNDGSILAQENGTIFHLDYMNGTREPFIDGSLSRMNASSVYPFGNNSFISAFNGAVSVSSPGKEGSITVTLACYGISEPVALAVGFFNAADYGYQIKVVDYSEYDAEGGAGAGMTRLRADIISGFTPDIFDLTGLPAEIYASRGIFEDLKPYFAEDNTKGTGSNYNISEELKFFFTEGDVHFKDFLPGIPELFDMDGQMYFVSPSIMPLCLTGPANIVGDENWDSEVFFNFAYSMEPLNVFGERITREALIDYLLLFNGNDYIDKEKLESDFSSSDFIRWLEFSKELPETDRSESQPLGLIANGEQALDIVNLNDAAVPGYYNTVFNGNAVFTGFPAKSKSNVVLVPECIAAVSVSSAHKEEAVNFIKFMLRMKNPGQGIPVLQECLDSQIEKAKDREAQYGMGKLHTEYQGEDISIESSLNIDRGCEIQREIISVADLLAIKDSALHDIVMRHCQAYWAGQSTAEQTASMIESTVNTYLSEQFG